ncbi:hypothetical protein DL96DRAFT_1720094 [Flagelloscypha sp. PMI_526]|nr:hypothetical protein DL96DRAFT_1720094 [Flagelloscypha sp. PMI_526]
MPISSQPLPAFSNSVPVPLPLRVLLAHTSLASELPHRSLIAHTDTTSQMEFNLAKTQDLVVFSTKTAPPLAPVIAPLIRPQEIRESSPFALAAKESEFLPFMAAPNDIPTPRSSQPMTKTTVRLASNGGGAKELNLGLVSPSPYPRPDSGLSDLTEAGAQKHAGWTAQDFKSLKTSMKELCAFSGIDERYCLVWNQYVSKKLDSSRQLSKPYLAFVQEAVRRFPALKQMEDAWLAEFCLLKYLKKTSAAKSSQEKEDGIAALTDVIADAGRKLRKAKGNAV